MEIAIAYLHRLIDKSFAQLAIQPEYLTFTILYNMTFSKLHRDICKTVYKSFMQYTQLEMQSTLGYIILYFYRVLFSHVTMLGILSSLGTTIFAM